MNLSMQKNIKPYQPNAQNAEYSIARFNETILVPLIINLGFENPNTPALEASIAMLSYQMGHNENETVFKGSISKHSILPREATLNLSTNKKGHPKKELSSN